MAFQFLSDDVDKKKSMASVVSKFLLHLLLIVTCNGKRDEINEARIFE